MGQAGGPAGNLQPRGSHRRRPQRGAECAPPAALPPLNPPPAAYWLVAAGPANGQLPILPWRTPFPRVHCGGRAAHPLPGRSGGAAAAAVAGPGATRRRSRRGLALAVLGLGPHPPRSAPRGLAEAGGCARRESRAWLLRARAAGGVSASPGARLWPEAEVGTGKRTGTCFWASRSCLRPSQPGRGP